MLRYLLILLVVLTTPVQATRLALLIGNGGYNEHLNGLKLTYLPHAVNDAEDMAEVLANLGFEVILATDVNKKAMKKAIRKFGKGLKTFNQKTDIGLFYYSGHGFQYNKVNYLVPLEVDIEHEVEIEDEALKADYVLSFMKSKNEAINIVILDACRTSIKNVLRKKKGFFDDALPGLAEMKAPVNSLIAYATQPNKDARSGLATDDNSLYTKHLLATLLNKPHLDVAKVFTIVRNQVILETKKENFQQIPWEQTSLLTNFCFGKCSLPIIDDELKKQLERERLEKQQLRQQLKELRELRDSKLGKINKLLKTCQYYMNQDWFTTSPTSQTALDCYRRVLKLDANNQQAFRAFKKMENYYVATIENFLRNNNKRQVEKYLARLRKVSPESPKIDEFEEKLRAVVPPLPAKNFRFIKLNYRGQRLANSASNWACIKDTHSGLIWEKKSKGNDKQGDNLHDADDYYTWYNTDYASNGGSDGYADGITNCYAYQAGKASSYCNSQAYTARVNAENYCGFNDWRMPEIEELKSLIDKAKKSAKKRPTINTDYFSNTRSNWYWSGSPLAGYPNKAWNVDFYDGYDFSYSRYYNVHVRLVRGGQ